MATFRIDVDLSTMNLIAPHISGAAFSHLSAAVERIAEEGAFRWVDAVKKARLWKGESDAYAASISHHMTGPYSAVITSDYKYVEDIESGRPPYDLKRMLNTSTKVRTTKDGRRFLVIPFRDNVAGMPPAVYAAAKDLKASTVRKVTLRPTGERTFLSPRSGMRPMRKQSPFLSNPATHGPFMTEKRLYNWGERLAQRDLRAAGVSKADAKKYAGMHRFDVSAGGAKSSAYIRFRIMMEGSTGWIIPARPGLHIAQGVVTGLRSDAETLFSGALQQDLAAAT